LSAYSANLVLLRLELACGAGVDLAELWPDQEHPLTQWRSTVDLWRSGLDTSGWLGMLSALQMAGGRLGLAEVLDIPASTFSSAYRVGSMGSASVDIAYAELIQDRGQANRIRLGSVPHDDASAGSPDDSWADTMVYLLFAEAILSNNRSER
jgi:hypothetical protein